MQRRITNFVGLVLIYPTPQQHYHPSVPITRTFNLSVPAIKPTYLK
jgi:hypothetical protein